MAKLNFQHLHDPLEMTVENRCASF